jgi:uncharacterized protein involved in exopolysaccharide biosynthesis
MQVRTNDTAAMGAATLSLAALWQLVLRRGRLLAALFLLMFGAAAAYVLTRPPRYEAQMKLLLKRARSEAPLDVERRQAGMVATELSDGEIESEIELFRNRDSLAAVVREYGLAAELRGPASEPARVALAVQQLGKRLSVFRIEKTNLIAVSLRDRDPERAARLLGRLAEIYLAKHTVLHRNQDSSQFFARQAEIYAQELDQAQRQLAEFRERHRVSLLAAEKEAALRRQDELERALQQTGSEIESARDRVAELRRQVRELPETVETQSRVARSETLLERLKATLLELENKRTELLTKYDSSYRLVREVDRQIEDTRRMLEQEQQARVVDRTSALNPLRQSLKGDLLRTETELAGLLAKRDKLAADLKQVRAGLVGLERITAEHDDLARRVKLAEENFLLYQRKREESRLADAMDRERILNVSIVEQAAPPAVPVDQHRAALLLLSAVMAAFASLGLTLAIDSAAPLIRAEQPSGAGRGPEAAAQTAAAAPPAPPSQPETGPEPATAASAEADRVGSEEPPPVPAVVNAPGIVERICRELALRDDYGRIVDFLASHYKPGDGLVLGLPPEIDPAEAALAAVQLAGSLHRRNGLPVLLIDAGGSRSPLAGYFGVEEAPGLQELLSGAIETEQGAIRPTGFENLWILPFGRGPGAKGANEARAASLHQALSTRSLNVIVYLPRPPENGHWPVFYSVLDAVLSSLASGEQQEVDADELVRRVVEAKRNFSERRLTLVGPARQWNNGSEESLTVC